jgi:tRNA dimethylallyltransferase
VNPSAGECGVKDQVSRPDPSSLPPAGSLVVVGPTASGKTALAVALARREPDLELVSIDAIAVYRHLDIGTAKPTASEREGVSWHGIDLVDPEEESSVARFRDEITATFEAIANRGHRAILVGGSGLYHRAVIDGLTIPDRYPDRLHELERRADKTGIAGLYRELSALDPVAASRIEPTNRRRILRALEVILGSGRRFSSFGPGLESYPETDLVLVGLRLPREVLDARIVARLAAQLDAGFLAEVRVLAERPEGLSRTARQAIGYRELLDYLDEVITYEEAVESTLRRTRTFARRQESWFRRDPRIGWVDAEDPNLVDTVHGLVVAAASSSAAHGTMEL